MLSIFWVASLLLAAVCAQITGEDIGIKLNKELARGDGRRIVYGSEVLIPGLSAWTDSQIVGLAFLAHSTMIAAFAADKVAGDEDLKTILGGGSKNRPTSTSVLVIGETAYISSSMKGGSPVYEGATAKFSSQGTACGRLVHDALTACQTMGSPRHKFGASCGEVIATLGYCTRFDGTATGVGGKVVAVDGNTNPRMKLACGGPGSEAWGCKQFLEALETSEIPFTTIAATVLPLRPDGFQAKPLLLP